MIYSKQNVSAIGLSESVAISDMVRRGAIMLKFCFSAFLLSLCLSVTANAASAPVPLTDDTSRADLFELLVKRMAANHEIPPGQVGLHRGFQFPDETNSDTIGPKPVPRQPSMFGIDVYHGDEDKCARQKCRIDWHKVADQNATFVYLKASQGNGFDPRYGEYYDAIKNLPPGHRLYVGAYHFLSSTTPVGDQVHAFLFATADRLPHSDLPPVLDLEWDKRKGHGDYDYWSNMTADDIVQMALGWLKAVDGKTGGKPFIYTNNEWWNERIVGQVKNKDNLKQLLAYHVWIAAYSTKSLEAERPPQPKGGTNAFWQFTDGASFKDKGVPGTVDASMFKGKKVDFEKVFGVTDQP